MCTKTNTLVTIYLDNAEALQQAVPLILSFAAVGSPPCVYFEATQSLSLSCYPDHNNQLDQMAEFGVTEIFANECAQLFLNEHFPSLGKVTNDAEEIRALHTQAHAIYAF